MSFADWLSRPAISIATVCDVLAAMGLEGVIDGVSQRWAASGTVTGRAHVAIAMPSEAPGIPGLAEFIDGASPGSFLFIIYKDESERSTFGGLAARAAQVRGCVGLISTGLVRDLEDFADLGFPVWARGVTPRSGQGNLSVPLTNSPVLVGATNVKSGDVVIADSTGVCVVPSSLEAEVLQRSRSVELLEEQFSDLLAKDVGFGETSRRLGIL